MCRSRELILICRCDDRLEFTSLDIIRIDNTIHVLIYQHQLLSLRTCQGYFKCSSCNQLSCSRIGESDLQVLFNRFKIYTDLYIFFIGRFCGVYYVLYLHRTVFCCIQSCICHCQQATLANNADPAQFCSYRNDCLDLLIYILTCKHHTARYNSTNQQYYPRTDKDYIKRCQVMYKLPNHFCRSRPVKRLSAMRLILIMMVLWLMSTSCCIRWCITGIICILVPFFLFIGLFFIIIFILIFRICKCYRIVIIRRLILIFCFFYIFNFLCILIFFIISRFLSITRSHCLLLCIFYLSIIFRCVFFIFFISLSILIIPGFIHVFRFILIICLI